MKRRDFARAGGWSLVVCLGAPMLGVLSLGLGQVGETGPPLAKSGRNVTATTGGGPPPLVTPGPEAGGSRPGPMQSGPARGLKSLP